MYGWMDVGRWISMEEEVEWRNRNTGAKMTTKK
jgi:hypothetical protein